ncbi:dihydrodipicolinate synthase family protein [Microbispora sp. RL4-1S]|uniref:Dihydrodipicolinate synthase family protein n=1 Tax=Microbispora oryzae TaxID=2806554 RepID=A0A941AG89_9ACTN|nr:dihydrodipicolinate synthase family protein [Microbispora oryzae]MBP2702655.1 dihydrodipicolinate synthase family protein [Microbispora oryzae]
MYSGTIVPLVTPLAESGAVSEQSVRRLVESLRHHVTALMPALSTGEGWKLSERQWHDVVAYSVRHSGGLPVLAGAQAPTTEEVVERARSARALGAAAVAVTTPFKPGLSQEEIYDHYRTLREAVPIPLFVYNEKALSGNQIELETLLRICRLPDVVGIKESSGSAEFTRALVAADPGAPVFEGWENLLYEAAGVGGFIGPLANLEPYLCNEMLATPSEELQAEINAVCERYGVFRDDWYAHVKKELHRRGLIESPATVDEVG